MKANILIVDDTPDNLRLLIGMLAERGYKTRAASNGRYALKTVQTNPPDLILLDIKMPGMDGYEVCEQLKTDERTRDIPVIFISALNGTFDKIKAFSIGGVDYITKPFQVEEVLARVETHLGLRNLQRRLQENNSQLQQEIIKRKQAEEELRTLNQQLQEMNASKDKFFSIISHDLRTPLNTLCVFPEVLIESIELYSKNDILKMARIQQDAAENLITLLENLLTWSKVQRGMIEYCPQQLDIEEVIAKSVALLKPNARQKQITLKTSIPERIWGYADFYMVDTVVRNLLSNALKFTNIGGSIEVSTRNNETSVEVSVSDTGIGISEEHLPKLFRIDAQYKRTGTAQESGTGLGLILCKEFVERNGGSIKVESEVGNGSTFRFTLPKKP